MRLHPLALTVVLLGTCGEPARSASSTETASDTPALLSWVSPLASQPSDAYRKGQPIGRPDLGFAPESATTTISPAARRITQAALLLLAYTGKITGAGHDTTADIGKPLLGSDKDPFASAIQGNIK